MLPIIVAGLSVLGGGAAFAAGHDIYTKGKALVQEHGPDAAAGLGGMFDKVTDLLDPLDITGTRAKRESDALDAQHSRDTSKGKAKLTRAQKKYQGKLKAQRKADKLAADKRVAEIEAKAKEVLASETAKARAAGASGASAAAKRAIAAAKQELSRVKAYYQAQASAAQMDDSNPVQEVIGQVLATVANGGHLPDNGVYSNVGLEVDAMEASGDAYDDDVTAAWDFV